MSEIQSIDLKELVKRVGSIQFLRVEWRKEDDSPFVLIRYAIDGRTQSLGLRLDLDKQTIVDSIEDGEANREIRKYISQITHLIQQKRMLSHV